MSKPTEVLGNQIGSYYSRRKENNLDHKAGNDGDADGIADGAARVREGDEAGSGDCTDDLGDSEELEGDAEEAGHEKAGWFRREGLMRFESFESGKTRSNLLAVT